jgi:Leucine-rich repeat (LRR) protein
MKLSYFYSYLCTILVCFSVVGQISADECVPEQYSHSSTSHRHPSQQPVSVPHTMQRRRRRRRVWSRTDIPSDVIPSRVYSTINSVSIGPSSPGNSNGVHQYICTEFYSPVQSSTLPSCNSMYSPMSDDPTDRGVLKALFQATFSQSDPWLHYDGWLHDSISVCCWYGISCDPYTQRVAEINLPGNNLHGVINPNLLTPLTELRGISLSHNSFQNSSLDAILFTSLVHLRYMDCLGCGLVGSLPTDYHVWQNLTCLVLSSNSLTGSLSPTIGALGKLEILQLEGVSLTGEIPSTLTQARRLRHVDFTWCSLSGSIPTDIGTLVHLETLLLGHNQLAGSIPESLCDLSQLFAFRCGANFLSGQLPRCNTPSGAQFVKLTDFYAESNDFSGTIPDWVCSVTKMERFFLEGNVLSGAIPPCIRKWSNLEKLSLADNLLEGTLPDDLGVLFQNLTILTLRGNYLTGPLPTSIQNLTKVGWFDLGHNSFHGTIPQLPLSGSLQYVDLENNYFNGSFPDLRIAGRNIGILHLGSNYMTGPIPNWIGELTKLRSLQIWGNYFIGTIPKSLGSLSNLELLHISYNRLRGEIPVELSNLPSLTQLAIARNQLTGPVPSEFARLHNLRHLRMSNNNLTGELGLWIRNLTRVDANHNFGLTFEPCVLDTASDFPCISSSDNLIYLDMSFNDISHKFELVSQTFGASGIINLKLAGNNILSTELVSLYLLDFFGAKDGTAVYRQEAFNFLERLDVSYNPRIQWSFVYASDTRPPPIPGKIKRLDVSHTGTVFPNEEVLKRRRLPLSSVIGKPGMTCPSLQLTHTSGRVADFIVSPDQYGYYSCLCENGRYLKQSSTDPSDYSCERCPAGATCFGDYAVARTVVSIDYGMFPVRRASGLPALPYIGDQGDELPADISVPELFIVACPHPLLCTPEEDMATQSFPVRDQDLVEYRFRCANGVDSRSLMCSLCLPSYIYWFGLCTKCPTVWLPIASITFVVAVFVWFWKVDWRLMPASSLLAISYLQLAPILIDFHSTKRVGVQFFQFIRWVTNTVTLIPVGLSCFNTNASSSRDIVNNGYSDFWTAAVTPLIVLCACAIAHYARNWLTPPGLSAKRLRDYTIGRVYFFLYILYLPTNWRVMSLFNCSRIHEIETSDFQFVDRAPWIRCDSEQYQTMFAVALVYTIVYGAGFPLYMIVTLYRDRDTLSQQYDVAVDRYGFLFLHRRRLAGFARWFPRITQGLHSLRTSIMQCFRRAPLQAQLDVMYDDVGSAVYHTSTRSISTQYEWDLYISWIKNGFLATIFALANFASAWTPILVSLVLGTTLSLFARLRPYRHATDQFTATFFIGFPLLLYLLEVLLLDTTTQASYESTDGTAADTLHIAWGLGEMIAISIVFIPFKRWAQWLKFMQRRGNDTAKQPSQVRRRADTAIGGTMQALNNRSSAQTSRRGSYVPPSPRASSRSVSSKSKY